MEASYRFKGKEIPKGFLVIELASPRWKAMVKGPIEIYPTIRIFLAIHVIFCPSTVKVGASAESRNLLGLASWELSKLMMNKSQARRNNRSPKHVGMWALKTSCGVNRATTQQGSLKARPCELKIEDLAKLTAYVPASTFWVVISLKSTSRTLGPLKNVERKVGNVEER